MKKLAIALMLLVSAVEMKLQAFDFDSNVDLGVGYRKDKFHYDTRYIPPQTAFNYQRSWHDINAVTLWGKAEFTTCDHWYAKVEGDYGWTQHGSEHFKSQNNVSGSIIAAAYDRSGKDGNLYDAEIALGYEFSFCCHQWYITPVVGWRWNGIDIKNSDARALGSTFADSGSHNRVRLNGVLVGFKAGWNVDCGWDAYLGYEWSPLRYKNHFTVGSGDPATLFGDHYSSSKSMSGNYFFLGSSYQIFDGWKLGGQLDWRWNWSKTATENYLGVNYQNRHVMWYSFGGEIFVGYAF
jgi:hypothetical protein